MHTRACANNDRQLSFFLTAKMCLDRRNNPAGLCFGPETVGTGNVRTIDLSELRYKRALQGAIKKFVCRRWVPVHDSLADRSGLRATMSWTTRSPAYLPSNDRDQRIQ